MRKLTSLSGLSLEVLAAAVGGLTLSLWGWWERLTSHWHGRTTPSASHSSVPLVGDRRLGEKRMHMGMVVGGEMKLVLEFFTVVLPK
jgi:prolyl-tRNA editing enzyme YbaK/EbsC (Cys-tRNA(Pro) deacylase)